MKPGDNLIRGLDDLADHLDARGQNRNETKRKIQRTVYKGTDCGAWISFRVGGVDVGSIVEGVDECTEPISLQYNQFTIDDFWGALTQIEEWADEIWNQAHACDSDDE